MCFWAVPTERPQYHHRAQQLTEAVSLIRSPNGMNGSVANRFVIGLGAIVLALMLTAAPAAAQERDPFDRGTVGMEAAAVLMTEIWNLNGRREHMIEGSASFWGAIGKRVAVGIEFHNAFVVQRTPGALVQGLSPLIRWKFVDNQAWDWFLETGPGVSWSDIETPPNGTKFNYLYQAGAGVIKRVGRASHLVIAYRFFHLSNNHREGREHNPDLEMMGAYTGWSFSF